MTSMEKSTKLFPQNNEVRVPVGFKTRDTGVLLDSYVYEILEQKPDFYIKRIYNYASGEYTEEICFDVDADFYENKIEYPNIAVFYAVYTKGVASEDVEYKGPEGHSC